MVYYAVKFASGQSLLVFKYTNKDRDDNDDGDEKERGGPMNGCTTVRRCRMTATKCKTASCVAFVAYAICMSSSNENDVRLVCCFVI